MPDPEIADKKPAVIELEPGTYWWCTCGKSKGQPFCDGAHSGTGFSPMKYELAEKRKVPLCLCKHTNTPPLCDGSHSSLA